MGFGKPHSCLSLLAGENGPKTLAHKKDSYCSGMWTCKYLVQDKLTCLKGETPKRTNPSHLKDSRNKTRKRLGKLNGRLNVAK